MNKKKIFEINAINRFLNKLKPEKILQFIWLEEVQCVLRNLKMQPLILISLSRIKKISEGKQKVFKKCLEYWDKKPDDFMRYIKNKDKHIPEEYREDIKYIK